MVDFMDPKFIFNLALVLVAAFAGGLTTAFMGFLGTPVGEKFNSKKFLLSVVVSFVGAVGITYSAYLAGVFNMGVILMAYMSGGGFEVGVNRGIDVIKSKVSML
jgi:hypothetical protein